MPKFGDIIENGWASADNPIRFGVFVRSKKRRGRFNPGTYYLLTDTKGKHWEIGGQADGHEKISVVGKWPKDWPVLTSPTA